MPRVRTYHYQAQHSGTPCTFSMHQPSTNEVKFHPLANFRLNVSQKLANKSNITVCCWLMHAMVPVCCVSQFLLCMKVSSHIRYDARVTPRHDEAGMRRKNMIDMRNRGVVGCALGWYFFPNSLVWCQLSALISLSCHVLVSFSYPIMFYYPILSYPILSYPLSYCILFDHDIHSITVHHIILVVIYYDIISV